jgi:hypothetical protein
MKAHQVPRVFEQHNDPETEEVMALVQERLALQRELQDLIERVDQLHMKNDTRKKLNSQLARSANLRTVRILVTTISSLALLNGASAFFETTRGISVVATTSICVILAGFFRGVRGVLIAFGVLALGTLPLLFF